MRLAAVIVVLVLCAAAETSAAAPFEDPIDPAGIAAGLDGALAAVQQAMDQLWQGLELLREAAAGAATQIVVPLPAGVPAAAGPIDAVAALAGLPGQWQALMAAARAKLGMPDPPGAAAVQHKADITGSPELSHEAATIAAADQQAASGALQQEIAVAATAAVARAAAHDTALEAAAAAARADGDQLAADAQTLPSSRAGIELLAAGMGAGMREQANLTSALAARITAVIQQTAQLSGQVAALAATLGIFTTRDVERERRALDAQLGVADAADGGAALLQQLLSGAGEPADEIRLDPLY